MIPSLPRGKRRNILPLRKLRGFVISMFIWIQGQVVDALGIAQPDILGSATSETGEDSEVIAVLGKILNDSKGSFGV